MFEQPERIEPYLTYGQTDVFICRGGEETFAPKFKYDGFRYAYVEGLDGRRQSVGRADAAEFFDERQPERMDAQHPCGTAGGRESSGHCQSAQVVAIACGMFEAAELPAGVCGRVRATDGYRFADGTTEKPLTPGETTYYLQKEKSGD